MATNMYSFWRTNNIHVSCKELAFAIRTLHCVRIVERRYPTQFNHGGAQEDQGKDGAKEKEAKANKAKQAVVDPLFLNDPWAKSARKAQTKWEDLELPQTHPFKDATDTPLVQLHRLQHAANKQGIILTTKQHLADISKIQTKGPLAVLLPGGDKTPYGEAAQHMKGPFEVVLEDHGIKSSYKRLVLLWVVQGDVTYGLPAPSTKCQAADYVELVAELDSRLVIPADFQQAKIEPMTKIKKLLATIHHDLHENVTMYGLRRNSSGPEGKDTHIQVICRVPRTSRTKMLEASGAHALLVRDFIDQTTTATDTTVLPRFVPPNHTTLHELKITTQAVPGAAGIVLIKRGLALRVCASVAQARNAFMSDDTRLTKDNIHVVPRHTLESSGWPTTIEASSLIKAVLEATGHAPIPTRAYRSAGVYSWTLAFETAPTKDRFTIEVGGTLHEILLVPTQARYNPKATQHQANPRAKKPKQPSIEPTFPAQAAIPLGNPTAKADNERFEKLEAKVGELEARQTSFERKFDNRLDGVDAALRQLLQRSETPRTREPTGDTPPPKLQKH